MSDAADSTTRSCTRGESTLAIWIACVGIGLLFLARGTFQNYISPLFTHLGGFSYAAGSMARNRVWAGAVRFARHWQAGMRIERRLATHWLRVLSAVLQLFS